MYAYFFKLRKKKVLLLPRLCLALCWEPDTSFRAGGRRQLPRKENQNRLQSGRNIHLSEYNRQNATEKNFQAEGICKRAGAAGKPMWPNRGAWGWTNDGITVGETQISPACRNRHVTGQNCHVKCSTEALIKTLMPL